MGDGNDGDFRLLAQIEPQPQGAMRGEVANKDVRQRTVVFFLVRRALIRLPVPVLRRPAVTTLGVAALRSIACVLGFGLGLFVLGSDEAAFDPHGAVMVEDDESAAACDVVGVIGLPLGLQPLDLGFKLAEPRIHISQEVPRPSRAARSGCRTRPAQHQGRPDPPPKAPLDADRSGANRGRAGSRDGLASISSPSASRRASASRAELCRYQQIEQRHVFEIAAAILGEEVAQDRAARLGVGLRTDKDRAAIRGGDMGLGQQAADGAGVAVIGQPLVDGLLPGMILGDGKGHQLLKRQITVAIDLHQFRARPHPSAGAAAPHGASRRTGQRFLPRRNRVRPPAS